MMHANYGVGEARNIFARKTIALESEVCLTLKNQQIAL